MADILVVDDAKFMRMTLTSILGKGNHEVVGQGENGQEAVDKFNELQPDLITLYITMPVKNGIEALKEIKAKPGEARVIMSHRAA